MENRIRQMVRQDLEQVTSLTKQLGYETSVSEMSDRFDTLKTKVGHALFVSENDRGISGYMHIEIVHHFIAPTTAVIKALVVDESQRGNRIGPLFLKEARQWAKTFGVNTLYLSCNTMREKAHSFYLREDFKLIKTSHFFEQRF